MSDFLKQHVDKIITIDAEKFLQIVSYFTKLKFRKRQFVVQESQKVEHMYLVEKGLLKSSFFDEAGKEHILQFAPENWWISDFAAFYKQEPSTIAVECIEDVEVWSIMYNDYEKLCRTFQEMEYFFRKKSNFGYVALQKRILSLMANDARERYQLFCNDYPDLVQRLPKQLIANYLGLSRETISRLQL